MATKTAPKTLRKPSPRAKNIVTVDSETWAASGGTAGMFGKAWKEGRLKIVESDD